MCGLIYYYDLLGEAMTKRQHFAYLLMWIAIFVLLRWALDFVEETIAQMLPLDPNKDLMTGLGTAIGWMWVGSLVMALIHAFGAFGGDTPSKTRSVR